jgi:hypothetical protein
MSLFDSDPSKRPSMRGIAIGTVFFVGMPLAIATFPVWAPVAACFKDGRRNLRMWTGIKKKVWVYYSKSGFGTWVLEVPKEYGGGKHYGTSNLAKAKERKEDMYRAYMML